MTQATELIAKQMAAGASIGKIWGNLIYNVKDTAYGAKGDGVTNDSAAVLAAIAAANGSPVYFPPGTYDVSAMTTVGGRVHLVSLGDAVIIGFKYQELNAPNQSFSVITSETDAYFEADGITFKGTLTTPGLSIKNQSQGTIIRSFSISNCFFRGANGLVTDNCISGTLDNCDFIHNQYGWKYLSCTNIVASNCQFFSPVFGIYIDTAASDTANRKGGENLKLDGCTFIDGVTAIWAKNHDYLWLDSCLIDYFNCGMYLQGCRNTRLDISYIGYQDTNKSTMLNYVAPTQYGCIYGIGDQTTSRSTGVESINSEFTIYGTSTRVPVKLDGSVTTFTGIEDCDFSTSRFTSSNTTNTMPYLLQIINAQDIFHNGNRYYSPLNSSLTAPWIFTNVNRIFSERNNFANCTTSGSVTISPSTGVVGNQKFESATITLSTDGTAETGTAVAYVYKNVYTQIPKVVATVQTGPVGQQFLHASVVSKDGTQAFVKVRHIDATTMVAGTNNITVDVIVMGD